MTPETASPAIVITVALILVTPNITALDDFGVVSPSGPFHFVSETLRLDCNITNASVRENSSALYFEHDNAKIPWSASRVLNTRSIRLQRHDLALRDEGVYTCLQTTFRGNVRVIGHQMVTIDNRPESVTNVSCMVYNWEAMTCTWDLGVHYRHPKFINVSVYWVTILPQSSPSAGKHYDCPDLTNTSCKWAGHNYMHGHTYSIRVVASYIVKGRELASASKQFSIDTRLYVMPAPVDDLEAQPVNSSCVHLTWKHRGSEGREKVFLGRMREYSQDDVWRDVALVPEEDGDLSSLKSYVCGLDPFTEYQIQIAVIPAPMGHENPGGHLSEWTEVVVWTDQGVPSVAPITCPTCFYDIPTMQSRSEESRMVRILWKAIPHKFLHGRLIHYTIQFWNENNHITKTTKTSLTWVDLALPFSHQAYNVSISGTTVKGTSRHKAHIFIPPHDKMPDPPKRFLVERPNKSAEGGHFYLSWAAQQTHKPSRKVSSQETPYTSEVSVTRDNVVGIYIVWCHGDKEDLNCKGDAQWVRLSPDEVTFELQTGLVDLEPNSLMIGVAKVSAVSAHGSDTLSTWAEFGSGVHWSKCVYVHGQKPETAPLNVRFSSEASSKGLTVMWEKPNCQVETSYIVEYLVRYCPTFKGNKCARAPRTMNVSSEVTMATLPDLASGTQYVVHVLAVSAAGLGPPSNFISHLVAADPPDKDVSGLIVIVAIIIVVFIIFLVIVCAVRRCIRQKRKIPTIKGLLDMPPQQPPQLRLHHQGRPLPPTPSPEVCHIYGTPYRVCMNNPGSEGEKQTSLIPQEASLLTKLGTNDLNRLPHSIDGTSTVDNGRPYEDLDERETAVPDETIHLLESNKKISSSVEVNHKNLPTNTSYVQKQTSEGSVGGYQFVSMAPENTCSVYVQENAEKECKTWNHGVGEFSGRETLLLRGHSGITDVKRAAKSLSNVTPHHTLLSPAPTPLKPPPPLQTPAYVQQIPHNVNQIHTPVVQYETPIVLQPRLDAHSDKGVSSDPALPKNTLTGTTISTTSTTTEFCTCDSDSGASSTSDHQHSVLPYVTQNLDYKHSIPLSLQYPITHNTPPSLENYVTQNIISSVPCSTRNPVSTLKCPSLSSYITQNAAIATNIPVGYSKVSSITPEDFDMKDDILNRRYPDACNNRHSWNDCNKHILPHTDNNEYLEPHTMSLTPDIVFTQTANIPSPS